MLLNPILIFESIVAVQCGRRDDCHGLTEANSNSNSNLRSVSVLLNSIIVCNAFKSRVSRRAIVMELEV